MQQSVLVITVDSRQAERNVKQLDKELANLTNRGETTGRALGGAFSTLTTYAAGFLTVATAINKIDMFTNMQNRLKLVTNGQQELNMAMSDTYRIAQQSYSSWSGVVQVYQRFSDNAKALNINMKQTAQLTETVSKAVAISGASAAAADAALTQFGQALASGALRGEELNSILEQTPALAKAIAEGMGITVGELKSVAAEGKITGEVLVDALTKSKKSVDELFSKTDITIGQSIEVLTNGVTKFIGEAGRGSGAANTLAGSIKLLGENISLVANVALAAGIGYITKAIATKTIAVGADIAAAIASRNANISLAQAELASATAATNDARAHLASTQATLAETEAKYGATAASVRYTTAQAALTAATNAETAAQARLAAATSLSNRVSGGALALMTGPVGLGLMVASVAAGYLLMGDNVDKSTNSLRENNGSVGDAIEKYRELNAIQRSAQLVNERDELEKLTNSYDDAVDKLERYADNQQSAATYTSRSAIELGNLFAEYKKTGDLEKFNNLVQSSSNISQNAKDKIAEYSGSVYETGVAANTQKSFIAQLTTEFDKNKKAATDSASGIDANTNALVSNTNAAKDAAKAQDDFFSSLNRSVLKANENLALINAGYTQSTVEGIQKLSEAKEKALGGNVTPIITQEEMDRIAKAQSILDSISKKQATISQRPKEVKMSSGSGAKASTRLADQSEEEVRRIMYEYSSDETKKAIDLQKEITRLQKYGQTQYIDIVKTRYEEEQKLAKMNFSYELSSFTYNEKQKAIAQFLIKKQSAIANTSLTKKQTEDVIASAKDQLDEELKNIDLAKRNRIFAAEEFQYTELDRIKKRYELEREEINKTTDLEERNALLQASLGKQNQEESNVRDQAISDYRGVMGFEENPLTKQFEVLDKMRELDLINEETYQNAKLTLQAKYTASYMEGMLGGFAALVDENSRTYAVLFAAQKAFAVAQAVMAIPSTYSKTVESISQIPMIGPYIAPAMGAAAAALQVVQAAKIKSTQMAGFESGGYTGNMGTKSVAGLVHGQEYVMNAKATKSIGVNNLESLSKTGELPNQQAQPVTNIINVFDESELRAAMATPAGEKIILNTITRNRSKLGM